jgi:hypothetical protein
LPLEGDWCGKVLIEGGGWVDKVCGSCVLPLHLRLHARTRCAVQVIGAILAHREDSWETAASPLRSRFIIPALTQNSCHASGVSSPDTSLGMIWYDIEWLDAASFVFEHRVLTRKHVQRPFRCNATARATPNVVELLSPAYFSSFTQNHQPLKTPQNLILSTPEKSSSYLPSPSPNRSQEVK